MADDEYDKLKDAHDAIADGDHPVEFAEAFTNWTAYTTGQLKVILQSEGLPVDRHQYDRAARLAEAQRINITKAQLIRNVGDLLYDCLLYTSPSPRDGLLSRMPSSA